MHNGQKCLWFKAVQKMYDSTNGLGCLIDSQYGAIQVLGLAFCDFIMQRHQKRTQVGNIKEALHKIAQQLSLSVFAWSSD